MAYCLCDRAEHSPFNNLMCHPVIPGLAGGSFPLVAALYVTECVEPNSRGAFGVFMNVMNVSGALFVNGVGSIVDWVALTGILIVFPGKFVSYPICRHAE